jgi:DNA-binding NtrC family response regulator
VPDPSCFRRVIHIWDPDATRCNSLAGALSLATGFQVEARLCTQSTDEHQRDRICSVVALSCPFRDEDMARLKVVKELGSVIAAYTPNATSLTLGSRCGAMLAGAPILLDSSTEDFESELARVVVEAVKQLDRQAQEKKSVLKAMENFAIIGRSSSMLSAFRLAQRISHFSDLPVLITGETGTGKELLAQAIYRQDEKRCHGTLVPFNCAAFNRELSDSELFGHRKGSFTGADRNRLGLFRAADNGVLFLDEIGELDLCLQAKLLRVLQDSRVLVVGEDQETPVNVRVLAATNRDLAKMVTAGLFREDLYHRLNVVSVHMPPLRERSEDIGALVDYFIQKYAEPASAERITAAPGFIEALQQASLPGNVRQLENLVRRAVICSNGIHPLDISDLPSEVCQEILSKSGSLMPSCRRPPQSETAGGDGTFLGDMLHRNNFNLDHCIDECEEQLIQAALARCQGNQAQTARLLGITPRSVYNKLRKQRGSAGDRKVASG